MEMHKLTFAKTGFVVDAPPGASFLQLCQDHDAPHDFGCTVGSCGTCALSVEFGADKLDPPTKDELDTLGMVTDVAGARLGCQLTIRGDLTIRQL